MTAPMIVALVAACGKGDGGQAGGKASGGPKVKYECRIDIRKKPGDPIKASASAPAAEEAEEKAWAEVCGKLAPDDQPNCKDPEKWRAQTTRASMAAGGPVTHTVTIELRRKVDRHTGRGESTADEDAACRTALADACKQAGATGDCVAAGDFEEVGQSTSKTTL